MSVPATMLESYWRFESFREYPEAVPEVVPNGEEPRGYELADVRADANQR